MSDEVKVFTKEEVLKSTRASLLNEITQLEVMRGFFERQNLTDKGVVKGANAAKTATITKQIKEKQDFVDYLEQQLVL